MNKLFKLIYVNLLALFNVNKVVVARETGVKNENETKLVTMGIMAIGFGCFLYYIYTKLNLEHYIYYLSIGFIISTLFCLIMDMALIEPIIFDSGDNDVLFSLPLSKNQIVFSKLFTIYLRNILFVVIIMFTSLMAYVNFGEASETMVLMFIVCTLFIPFIPIVIDTLLAYANDYFKIKMNNKKLFNILKYVIIICVLLIVLVFLKGNIDGNIGDVVEYLVVKLNVIYPLGYLFIAALGNENILFFFAFVFICISFIYMYNLMMSNNILKISSMLQGVNKNSVFVYHGEKNWHTVMGMFRKEMIYLFKNKMYFISSFYPSFITLIVLLIGINVVNIDKMKELTNFNFYFNSLGPAIIAMLNCVTVSTVCAMSMEKTNIQILRSLPISMSKVLFAKWLVNFVIELCFIVIDVTLLLVVFGITGWDILAWYLLPISIMMFISLLGLVLDYRFIAKNEESDHVIIRQRLVVIVPTFFAFVIGITPIFLNVFTRYRYLLGAYIVAMFVGMTILILYLIICRKKLVLNLVN